MRLPLDRRSYFYNTIIGTLEQVNTSVQETTMESIIPILEQVQEASLEMRTLSDQRKKDILYTLATLIKENNINIIEENQKDLVRMDDSNPKKDRLLLNHERIQGLVDSINSVAKLPDPTQQVISSLEKDNGLVVEKVSSPLGVVGLIYESRPNVTIDVAALCIRSGNAAVMRGGSDAYHSNKYLVSLIHKALEKNNVNTESFALLPTNRKFVKEMLEADQFIDIIIPRGSQELIDFVRANATVPTIETGAGVCHTYVTAEADLQKAAEIVVNAKVSRPSVCNALDTIIVDQAVAADFLPLITAGMNEYEVQIYADDQAFNILEACDFPRLKHASDEDFGREFLDFKCSVKVVDGFNDALSHIRRHSSKHSEAIISENPEQCDLFLKTVDAAAVYTNASTRFTDGSEFGLGAEIGISTQKLHARGPFALEKLTTEKWIVRGNGQVRW